MQKAPNSHQDLPSSTAKQSNADKQAQISGPLNCKNDQNDMSKNKVLECVDSPNNQKNKFGPKKKISKA